MPSLMFPPPTGYGAKSSSKIMLTPRSTLPPAETPFIYSNMAGMPTYSRAPTQSRSSHFRNYLADS
ncbi:hypothetical protein B0H17DRAFT_1067687 [Mycena rosella]|uniref:Uncharacterized protein n=1 Tax=Mycena rosella TaxID=1033263 RepID=A0AAD7DDA7_MYCRO|nr:hypothetical protein B0H17DRAFT_1067687 [Mycena rosella]